MSVTFRSGHYTATDYTPSGADVSAGDVVVPTNGVPLVAHHDIADGALGALAISGGIYTAPKATGTAWVPGTRLYWDAADGELNTDDANPHFGFAAEAAASGDDEGIVEHRPDGLAPAA